MLGNFSLNAKIFAGLDQSDAKELLPKAIDGDTGGEWVIAMRQPAGQIQTIEGLILLRFQRRQ